MTIARGAVFEGQPWNGEERNGTGVSGVRHDGARWALSLGCAVRHSSFKTPPPCSCWRPRRPQATLRQWRRVGLPIGLRCRGVAQPLHNLIVPPFHFAQGGLVGRPIGRPACQSSRTWTAPRRGKKGLQSALLPNPQRAGRSTLTSILPKHVAKSHDRASPKRSSRQHVRYGARATGT